MKARVQFCAVPGTFTDVQPADTGAKCLVSGGALGGIRTPNLLIRSQMLYPLSYERQSSVI